MGFFHRGDNYRLEDMAPKQRKIQRQLHTYRPPKPLSGLSCALLLLLAAALLCYSVSILTMRLFGVEAEAIPNTRLDASGAVTKAEIPAVTSTLYLTFRDGEGAYHEGTVSLLGNTEPPGKTVKIRYFPRRPQCVMLFSQTNQWMLPIGSLFLSMFLARTAIRKLLEEKKRKNRNSST
ncbi:MAG: hypothetical protein IJ705_09570 [Oscillospiraceae bacterium]|nr:hypothetical protein [Oscillospiraceae bacterium]